MTKTKLEWRTWLKNGDQYLKAATPKGKKSRFRPEIRYNLLSLSLEGYIMAILGYHNSLPFNHTYTDLILSLDEVLPLNEKLRTRILQYENIQDICSIDKYLRKKPTEDELEDLNGAIIEMSAVAHQTCLSKWS